MGLLEGLLGARWGGLVGGLLGPLLARCWGLLGGARGSFWAVWGGKEGPQLVESSPAEYQTHGAQQVLREVREEEALACGPRRIAKLSALLAAGCQV